MARRRLPGGQPSPGALHFDRTPAQWRQLGAPVWACDPSAAAEAYVSWTLAAYGGRLEPTDPLITRFYAKHWLARCVKPQLLAHLGALTPTEQLLMSTTTRAKWGRPGHCPAPMLTPDAGVPSWLACCRRDPQSQRGRDHQRSPRTGA